MPIVPISQGSQVQEVGYKPAQISGVSIDKEVLKVQENVAQAGQNLGNTFARIEDEADRLRAQEAYNEYAKKKIDIFSNPNDGILHAQGKDAFTAAAKGQEKLKTAADTTFEGLASPRQKKYFESMLQREDVDNYQKIQTHVSQQIRKHEAEVTGTSIKLLQDRAQSDFVNPQRLAENLAEQDRLVVESSKKYGLTDDMIKLKIQETRAKTHGGVLESLLARGDDQTALNYFANIKDQLGNEDQAKFEKFVTEASMRGQSQRLVDELMTKTSDLNSGLKALSSIENPRLREEAETRLVRMNSLKETAKRQSQDRIQIAALNLIDSGKGIDDIPPQQWSVLDDGQRKGIMSYMQSRAKGEDRKTNNEVYYDLKDLAATQPENFKKLNLLEYQGSLSNTDLRKFIDIQTKVNNGKSLDDGYMSNIQVINNELEIAGIKDKTEQAEIKAYLDEQFAKSPGKKNEDIRRLARDAVKEVVVKKGFFFDDTKKKYQLTPEEKAKTITIDQISQENKSAITTSLKKRGITADEKMILEIYRRGILSKAGG